MVRVGRWAQPFGRGVGQQLCARWASAMDVDGVSARAFGDHRHVGLAAADLVERGLRRQVNRLLDPGASPRPCRTISRAIRAPRKNYAAA